MDREYQRLLYRDSNPFSFLYKGNISVSRCQRQLYWILSKVSGGITEHMNLLICLRR